MSAVMEPLRHLLRPDTWTGGFNWTPELDKTFQLAKAEIISSVTDGVKHFDVNVDLSSHRLESPRDWVLPVAKVVYL